MKLRSLLFVPGDRPDRMRKALASGADALILDLEDAVSPGNKAVARDAIAQFVSTWAGEMPVFVRVNDIQSESLEADLALVAKVQPYGVLLPKAQGAETVTTLDAMLTGVQSDARILPIAAETPGAVFSLGAFGSAGSRLCGLTWGVEDLCASLGSMGARDKRGAFTAPFEVVRALVLMGAHAAAVPAIETVYPAVRDTVGLAACAWRARRDGFRGMMAIHPAQVPVINDAFAPSAEERAWAREVVQAFSSNPGAGALSVGGRMVDAPHLKRAQQILE